jgi:hypothetical protein
MLVDVACQVGEDLALTLGERHSGSFRREGGDAASRRYAEKNVTE